MTQLFLLLMQISFSVIPPVQAEDFEKSLPYPTFYEYTDSMDDESDLEKGIESPKDKPSAAWEGNIGKAKVTVDVENTDFLSQCQAKWEGIKKKNEPKKEKRSRFRKDDEEEEEKDYSPCVSAKIHWSN